MLKSFKTRRLRKFYTCAICFFTLGFLLQIGQVRGQFWFEDFGSDFILCESQNTLAEDAFSPNGQWTVEEIGFNGPLSNKWFIGAAEAGLMPGACNQQCMNNDVFERTLHIGRNDVQFPGGNQGAIYFELTFPNTTETDRRAASPVIDCTGQWAIEMEFNYIHSLNATDFCVVDYFDGEEWSQLLPLPASPAGCAPQRQWTSLSVNLPSSANNNPNVRIGFRWRNNADGITNGGNLGHSVAIDNIVLTSGPAPVIPVADFSISQTEICEVSCVTYTANPTFDPNFSVGATGATYEWTFPGGTPETSTNAIVNVCYNTPGLYDATLVVTDNIGESLPFTETDAITVNECGPTINISVNQNIACANEECFEFTDLSTGLNVFAWTWTFTSPTGVETVSNQQNPTVCLTEFGFYTVTLEAQDEEGTSIREYPNFMQVIDCTGPDVDFSASRMVICPGECIQFTDLSSSDFPIFAWFWTLPGGQAQGEAEPGASTQQNPLVCYENPGTYNVTLAAQDQEGLSAITKTIQIVVDPCTGPPSAAINSSATTICTGDCVDFFSESLGLIDSYLWVFQGVTDINSTISNEQNPQVVCYQNPGTYNVTLTVSNNFGQVDSRVFQNYITVEQCVNKPVPRIQVSADTVCAGKCVQFQSVSTGLGITDVEWNFQGGEPTQSTLPNPEVCYNTPGSYSVSLKVSGAGGDSTRVFQNRITVISGLECRPTISITAPDTICAGDCANFTAVIEDAIDINWTFLGGNPASSTAMSPGLVCFNQIGTVPVIVEASNVSGAATPVVHELVVLPRPALTAGPDFTINAGTPITLTANILGNPEPAGTFRWQPFDLVDNFTRPRVNAAPRETTTFIVSYKEPGGCRTVDSVTVFVNFIPDVGVPNSFSPNGDGVNDELRVMGQGITQMDFRVFNRYGQMVWQTNDQTRGWDGTQNGRPLNPATFVWVLDVRFTEGGEQRFTGDVTLVR